MWFSIERRSASVKQRTTACGPCRESRNTKLPGPHFARQARDLKRSWLMGRGDKSKYTNKQERMADHIEEGYEKRGVSKKEAERRAWATVNKQTGGGNKPGGSGRGKPDTSAGNMTRSERSRAAKKGWATRRSGGRG